MKEEYFDSVQALERLHRLFLDVVKAELDHLAIFDINNVQTIVLCNIGTNQLTIGELTNRGYYLGSNVSYNLRKMVQNEYIIQVPTPHDRRSSQVKLSQKGLDLYKKFDRIFHNHAEGLNNKGGKETLALLGSSLQKLERFWTETSAKERR
ncbi:MAG: MarR family winged helix-turn-helix transcriptional regulator [Proteobacteria bacterium]|jgi:DNA-binding MarR family transcriptional regulator|nr:MarR family winged helix-turn-helix transcriptional regulator [Pseudomonadota bacterium]